jgi:hypothetical protein
VTKQQTELSETAANADSGVTQKTLSKDSAVDNERDILSDVPLQDIKELILTIRGKQVLLDSDVARLYGYATKEMNKAANRNKERFPPEFRFQLTQEEGDSVSRFQTGTLKLRQGKNVKYLPFAYTEQGIGMLSGILRNSTAVQVSIGIMNAFVEMRRFLNANQDVFAKILHIDNKLLEHDQKFDEVFDLLQQPEAIKQSVFYKGQFYDAYQLVRSIIKLAKTNIIIIDNYVDETLLDTLTAKGNNTTATVITSSANRISKQALTKYKEQYGQIELVISKEFHDRFIILDNKEVYALGASIKDLGNKCFEISKPTDTKQLCDYVRQIVEHGGANLGHG